MNAAFLASVYQGKSGKSNEIKKKYVCWAQEQARYILGDNMKYVYIIG